MSRKNSPFCLLFGTLCLLTGSIAFAGDQDNNNINLHAHYRIGKYSVGQSALPDQQQVSMVINGELVLSINTISVNPYTGMYSLLPVPGKYNSQEIKEAKFDLLAYGKKYRCSAQDLPLYVQGEPYPTELSFLCK